MTPEERAEIIFLGRAWPLNTDDDLIDDLRKDTAEAIREAVAEERERCAGIADAYDVPGDFMHGIGKPSRLIAQMIASQIRNTTNDS